MLLTFFIKCEYISLSLYINEDRIPADVPRCWAFWNGSPELKVGWSTCAIGQPKVGTLDRRASSVAVGFAVVKVSKGALSHYGRQVGHTCQDHSGTIYIAKTKAVWIFLKVSCNRKTRTIMLQTILVLVRVFIDGVSKMSSNSCQMAINYFKMSL